MAAMLVCCAALYHYLCWLCTYLGLYIHSLAYYKLFVLLIFWVTSWPNVQNPYFCSIHACTHTHVHAHTSTHMHTLTHNYTYIQPHTHTHTQNHTHTEPHTQTHTKGKRNSRSTDPDHQRKWWYQSGCCNGSWQKPGRNAAGVGVAPRRPSPLQPAPPAQGTQGPRWPPGWSWTVWPQYCHLAPSGSLWARWTENWTSSNTTSGIGRLWNTAHFARVPILAHPHAPHETVLWQFLSFSGKSSARGVGGFLTHSVI